MTTVRYLTFMLLMMFFVYGQAQEELRRTTPSSQIEIPVRRLYQQLVSRPIGAIPPPEIMKPISPFLSSALLHRISLTRACSNDWFRLHPQRDVKPPFAWGEFGLFSGADDRSAPDMFKIEGLDAEKDGSFRVHVRLTEGRPPEKRWTWHVADVLTREDGRYVISDVVFLRDKDVETETRLSEILTKGCDGSHWIGFDKEQNQAK
jgi:hypothetical protein